LNKAEKKNLIDASTAILTATHHIRYASKLIKHPVLSVLIDELRAKSSNLDDLICKELRR
jgi:hypothetical protein